MPGQEAMRAAGVFAAFVVEAAEDRVLVGHLRQARQVLADVDAGDVGADRPKLAADLVGGAGLEIEGLQMARPAVGPEEDDREIARGPLIRQNLREARRRAGTKSAEAEAPELQPGAAIERTGARKRWRVRHPISPAGYSTLYCIGLAPGKHHFGARPINWSNSSSVNTFTPSCLALSSLLPAFSPATRYSVFFETLLAALPPSWRMS